MLKPIKSSTPGFSEIVTRGGLQKVPLHRLQEGTLPFWGLSLFSATAKSAVRLEAIADIPIGKNHSLTCLTVSRVQALILSVVFFILFPL